MALEGRSRRNRNRPSRRVVALPASFNKVRETALTLNRQMLIKISPPYLTNPIHCNHPPISLLTPAASVKEGADIKRQRGRNWTRFSPLRGSLLQANLQVSTAIAVSSNVAVSYSVNQPSSLAYKIGSGTIGINGSVSPAQVIGTQAALSTSGTTPPTSGWVPATIINNNTLWAVYLPGPTVPGTYYVWVETSMGQAAAVSSFTITAS